MSLVSDFEADLRRVLGPSPAYALIAIMRESRSGKRPRAGTLEGGSTYKVHGRGCLFVVDGREVDVDHMHGFAAFNGWRLSRYAVSAGQKLTEEGANEALKESEARGEILEVEPDWFGLFAEFDALRHPAIIQLIDAVPGFGDHLRRCIAEHGSMGPYEAMNDLGRWALPQNDDALKELVFGAVDRLYTGSSLSGFELAIEFFEHVCSVGRDPYVAFIPARSREWFDQYGW